MNRFIKWVLIAATVCLAAGLLMSGCAASMGGSILRIDGNQILSDGLGGLIGRVIRGNQFRLILGTLNGFHGSWDDTDGAGVADDYENEPLDSVYLLTDIRDLEIVAAPSRIEIVEGETDDCIRVERNSEKIILKDKVSDDGLKLTFEKEKGIVNLPDYAKAVITIPKDQHFRRVELEADASSIDADRILADKLDISAGAASVEIGSVSADEMKLEANAGSIEITEGTVKTLEIESAMGSVDYTGAVEESVEADSEMGTVRLTLDGAMKDFNYQIDSSMGGVTVEGLTDARGGLKGKQTVKHDGAKKTAKLDCSMGSVEMNFR